MSFTAEAVASAANRARVANAPSVAGKGLFAPPESAICRTAWRAARSCSGLRGGFGAEICDCLASSWHSFDRSGMWVAALLVDFNSGILYEVMMEPGECRIS